MKQRGTCATLLCLVVTEKLRYLVLTPSSKICCGSGYLFTYKKASSVTEVW